MTTANPSAEVLIGMGEVRHTRFRPALNRFVYPTYFLMLPMRSLRATASTVLARNHFGLISFYDRDHGDGSNDSLAWLERLLAREGVTDASGEVWLHCYPRVLVTSASSALAQPWSLHSSSPARVQARLGAWRWSWRWS